MKGRVSVRFDERTIMLLSEISDICNTSISTTIRYLISKEIESVLDEGGYIHTRPIKHQHTQNQPKQTTPITIQPIAFDEDWYMDILIKSQKKERHTERGKQKAVRIDSQQLRFHFK
jgi:ATP sulfurylase